ncbi:MAG: hypothetical protein SXA11_01985 [Cyanobacteriota bacterium]|nr:hypothetical protein [Cyanobacteriota bacterium]
MLTIQVDREKAYFCYDLFIRSIARDKYQDLVKFCLHGHRSYQYLTFVFLTITDVISGPIFHF